MPLDTLQCSFSPLALWPTYKEHPIMSFEGKQIIFWTSFSSIKLFSTTIRTIPVKEWLHLDHWPLNYRPKKSAHTLSASYLHPLHRGQSCQFLFTYMAVINPLERKLAKCTSVHCTVSKNFCTIWQFCPLGFQLWPCMHCSSYFKDQSNRFLWRCCYSSIHLL